ncbi:MAG TPA: hypothetical protein VIL39_00160 [Verrucomicrobiae bacterium]
MPTTCCLHRAYTLLTRWQQAEWWLAVPGLEGWGTDGRRKRTQKFRPGPEPPPSNTFRVRLD